MLPLGSFVTDAAASAGFLAASIAICGFLGQIKPALAREEDPAVRAATVIGGMFGLAAAGLILFTLAMLLLLATLYGGLSLLGAGNEQLVLAYFLVLTIAGLGVGEIVSRYHRRG